MKVLNLVAIALSGRAKITASVNLVRHLKQVTTPDHNLSDYCLCVVTAHALRNYRHTHWSEPVWPAVYTCTPMELRTKIKTCGTHGAKPTWKEPMAFLVINDYLGYTSHYSFLEVFYITGHGFITDDPWKKLRLFGCHKAFLAWVESSSKHS